MSTMRASPRTWCPSTARSSRRSDLPTRASALLHAGAGHARAALNTGERSKLDWQGNIKAAATETRGARRGVHERDEIERAHLDADTHITSGYGELQSQFGEHWFSALNVRYDDNNRFGSKVTYRFAPAWRDRRTPARKLQAPAIGTGFKAPTLSELYQDFPPSFFANPNLKPESSTGWDAGFEQAFAGDALRFGVTYFYNRIRNLIVTDPITFGTTYANVGRATTDGIESFIAWQPLKTLTLRADYTYTEATDDVLQQELLRRPEAQGGLRRLEWRPLDPWLFDLDGALWVGAWADGTRETFRRRVWMRPGYTTVNLRGQLRPQRAPVAVCPRRQPARPHTTRTRAASCSRAASGRSPGVKLQDLTRRGRLPELVRCGARTAPRRASAAVLSVPAKLE